MWLLSVIWGHLHDSPCALLPPTSSSAEDTWLWYASWTALAFVAHGKSCPPQPTPRCSGSQAASVPVLAVVKTGGRLQRPGSLPASLPQASAQGAGTGWPRPAFLLAS